MLSSARREQISVDRNHQPPRDILVITTTEHLTDRSSRPGAIDTPSDLAIRNHFTASKPSDLIQHLRGKRHFVCLHDQRLRPRSVDLSRSSIRRHSKIEFRRLPRGALGISTEECACCLPVSSRGAKNAVVVIRGGLERARNAHSRLGDRGCPAATGI